MRGVQILLWTGLSDTFYWKRFQSALRCFPFKGLVLSGMGKRLKASTVFVDEICQEWI
jgi:hypothetical protein